MVRFGSKSGSFVIARGILARLRAKMVRLGENWVKYLLDHARKNTWMIVASAGAGKKSESFSTGCILVQSKKAKKVMNFSAFRG